MTTTIKASDIKRHDIILDGFKVMRVKRDGDQMWFFAREWDCDCCGWRHGYCRIDGGWFAFGLDDEVEVSA